MENNILAFKIAEDLRKNDINVDIEMTNLKLKKALNVINEKNIPIAIILGSDEIKENKITIKDMRNSFQIYKKMEDYIGAIKELLSLGKLSYKILNPGGNITALVKGSDYSTNQKKLINKLIMSKYSQVEQVGFLSNRIKRLEMAGGEFCMNATICAVYEYTKNIDEPIEILVSGTNQKIVGKKLDENNIELNLDINKKIDELIEKRNDFTFVKLDGILIAILDEEKSKKYINKLKENVERAKIQLKQIMTSKTPSRTMEDIDEKALSYGEIKALATGNPLILEKTNLDSEISKLKLLKQNFMNQKYALQDKVIKYYPEEITRLNNKIAAMEEDTIKLQEYTKINKDGFSPMIIDGKEYSEKADAGKKLLECTQLLKSMEVKEIGEYRGFKMEISFDSFSKNIKLKLKNKFSYSIDLGTDINGNITRINNCLENIVKDIPLEREKLDNTKFQLQNAKEESQKEFPQEQLLKEKLKKLDEINAELKINDTTHEIFGNEQEEKENKSLDKKSPERC